ncbi:MAG: molybdopterin converting factor subunit 1 [Geminicoccaceae bacterium]|nr:molybdopterin converting factor subunit 1 [Geminicoccaceae bacterium]
MKIRYFAWLRQRTGCGEEEIALPDGIATVAELAAWLGERHPRFAEALAARGIVRCALNQVYVEPDAAVRDEDEIAFFPPVTGG